MKVYGIKPAKVKIGDFEIDAVSIGEHGRGRQLVNVACPQEFEFLEPGTTKNGRFRLNRAVSREGWIARICTAGAYIRGANGNVSTLPEFADRMTVAVRGHGAFGDAGRIGSWDDIVICTDMEDFWVRVKPSRGDAFIMIFRVDGKVNILSYEEAELLDMDLKGSSSNDRGELIRL